VIEKDFPDCPLPVLQPPQLGDQEAGQQVEQEEDHLEAQEEDNQEDQEEAQQEAQEDHHLLVAEGEVQDLSPAILPLGDPVQEEVKEVHLVKIRKEITMKVKEVLEEPIVVPKIMKEL